MSESVALDYSPADAERYRAEIERMFADIDRSLKRMERDQQRFERSRDRTRAVLAELQRAF